MTRQLFKQLPYQAVAAQSVVDCFAGQPRIEGLAYQIDPGRDLNAQGSLLGEEGLRNADLQLKPAQLRENVRAVQVGQHLTPSDALVESKAAPINLDVEMETGTGKTYVYIETMYRLHRQYGWSKFIVVVPSVAIREGVFQTFADTEDHFQALYGHKVRRFIYDSGRPEPILAFSDSPGLHCMIINTQAFASEVRAEGKESKTLRMFREMDQFGSRRPIDLIAANRPILILDEPQRLEGATTQNALARFKAPIALRYSATHRTQHNLVHRLDALDAYNRKLVKRINVRGVTVKNLPGTNGFLYLSGFRTFTDGRPPEARVQIEVGLQTGTVKRRNVWLGKGDSLHAKSGGLTEYESYVVSDIDALNRTLTFTNGEVLEEGRVVGDVDETAVRRIQIRETIRSHFDRERQLHTRGIKVLSLFFIDEVAKYRRYGEDGEQLAGEYAAMFEEEYSKAVSELAELDASDAAWHAYVKRDAAPRVHQGYFSIDKKGRMVDPDVNKTGEESGEAKDASSYDLILRDKARLLSVDEPVRFIFSHSALREGWDNPNVFTICTLKHSDNRISRRQEVGRGMRLCVNQYGERMDHPSTAHDINVLTVVANESYEDFVKGLQGDISDSLSERPRKADKGYFTGKVLHHEQTGEELEVTDALARQIEKYLIKNDYSDDQDLITETYHKAKKDDDLAALPDDLKDYATSVFQLVDSVFSEAAIQKPEDGRAAKANVLNKNFEKKEFQDLWGQINRKAAYTVEFESAELIKKAIAALNKELRVKKLEFRVKRGEQASDLDFEDMKRRDGFVVQEQETEHVEMTVGSTVTYDLIGEIAEAAELTRRTVAAILQGL